ncbi:hypothetical protein GOBAR_AA36103 [Gossypium barbadense]|uniref:Uncharacterized protein n=1 Tax=Gossypium barbadense TaxID=3634 RepID=A0A2P5W0I9_GOSBA|nr:hypothetical protein GOBAR_AA36103 [Gossypium barbadense]
MASFCMVSFFLWLFVSVSNSEACTRDIDCLGQCKHGGFCDLITKKCSCLPVSEQLPSNIAATVDAMQR